MTKKDYVKIAAILNSVFHDSDNDGERLWARVAVTFADMLAADNPRFDYNRFYKACGMECLCL